MLKRNAIPLAILLATASCLPPDHIGHVVSAGSETVPPRLAFEPLHDVAIGLQVPFPVMPALLRATPAARPGAALLPHTGEDARRALECLTAAVYYEARSEPVAGQRAVAQVVLNRVRDPAFPGSVCGVVYQGAGPYRRVGQAPGCQFQFACDGSMLLRRDEVAWRRARAVAEAAIAGGGWSPVGGATYYHATSVSPAWAPGLQRVAAIGAHIFYSAGAVWQAAAAQARRYAGIEPLPLVPGAGAPVDAIAVHRPGLEPVDAAGVLVHRNEQVAGIAVHRGVREGATRESMPAASPVEAADAASAVRVHVGAPAGEGVPTASSAVIALR